MKNKYISYSVFTALLVLIVLSLIRIFDLAYPVNITTSSRSSELAVTGEGKVEVVPDVATVDAGIVVNNAPSIQEVQKKMDEINNVIIEKAKQLNIKKEDIKTQDYSINPNYDYVNNQNRISGYNGNATVSIKVRDTQMVSQVIAAATDAGANQVNGARFSVENPGKYREEARNKAITNAKDQAKKLSQELGLKLGSIVNLVESSSDGGVMPYMTANAKDAMGRGGEVANIEPGSQTITSVVTVYFEKK